MTSELHSAARAIVALIFAGYMHDAITGHSMSGFIERSFHEIVFDVLHVPKLW